MGWVLADEPLTFVRRHQQIQSLLGQIGPNQRDLLSQLSVTLVLFNTPCRKGEKRSHEEEPKSLSFQCIPPLTQQAQEKAFPPLSFLESTKPAPATAAVAKGTGDLLRDKTV